jgi:hypothetical protein
MADEVQKAERAMSPVKIICRMGKYIQPLGFMMMK